MGYYAAVKKKVDLCIGDWSGHQKSLGEFCD